MIIPLNLVIASPLIIFLLVCAISIASCYWVSHKKRRKTDWKEGLKMSIGTALLFVCIIAWWMMSALDKPQLYVMNNSCEVEKNIILSEGFYNNGKYIKATKPFYILNQSGLGLRYRSIIYGNTPENYQPICEIIYNNELKGFDNPPSSVLGAEVKFITVKRSERNGAVRYLIEY